MAYAKRYVGGFVDLPSQTTAIDSTFLNAVEAALLKLFDTDPTVDGQVQSWIAASTKFGPALLLNKNIDPAAAIAKSKLDLTGANGIVNADVAGAAAIARSKLDFGSGLVNADISASAAIAATKLAAPYTAWAPTLIGTGGNPNLGSTGTVSGGYVQIGKLVHAWAYIMFGGSGITQGTGTYEVSLPVAPAAGQATNFPLGTWLTYDGTASSRVGVAAIAASPLVAFFPGTPASSAAWASGTFTYVAGGEFLLNVTYQAA